jgi:membrane protein DedA with SNARE-associated domain
MDFTEVKGLLQSKTIWGVIITILGAILGWGSETQAVLTDQTMLVVSAVVQAIGAVIAIIGRIKADKKVTVTGS